MSHFKKSKFESRPHNLVICGKVRSHFTMTASNDNINPNSEPELMAVGQRLLALLILHKKITSDETVALRGLEPLREEMKKRIETLTSQLANSAPETDNGTTIKAFAKRYAKTLGMYEPNRKEASAGR